MILLIVFIAVGLASTAYIAMSRTGGDTVIIEKNGELYGTYSLLEDKEIDVLCVDSIGSDVHVSIKDGFAQVTESGCTNQVCVRHSAISQSGESIICLPNRVVVKIEGEGGGYDAVTS